MKFQPVVVSSICRGVFTHFHGRFPAAKCDLLVKDSLVKLVGACYPDEVACMNGLSVNMHLLLLSFYRPTPSRYKIMIEEHAFPSDRVGGNHKIYMIILILIFPFCFFFWKYGVISQLNMHGYSEAEGLVILKSRPGEHVLQLDDILSAIQEHGESISVIFLSGIHYYTGINWFQLLCHFFIKINLVHRTKVWHPDDYKSWTRTRMFGWLGSCSRRWQRRAQAARMASGFCLLVHIQGCQNHRYCVLFVFYLYEVCLLLLRFCEFLVNGNIHKL